jgi:hypothetical protein
MASPQKQLEFWIQSTCRKSERSMEKGRRNRSLIALIVILSTIFVLNLTASCPDLLPDRQPPQALPIQQTGPDHLVIRTEIIDSLAAPFHEVQRSSRRFFKTNGITPSLSFERTFVQRSPSSTDIYVKLPPYYWALPLGLGKRGARLFWKQPENHLPFTDSTKYTTGKVQVFYNASLTGFYSPHSNRTHYFNYDSPMVKPCANPAHDVIMLLMAHDIRDWRHFLTRGVAHISLMEMATGIDPATVTFVVDPWDSEHIPYFLDRYGFKNVMTRTQLSTEEFSAARIVLAQVVPIVHPSYFHRFLDRLKFNFSNEGADKVVLVSRAAYDHVEQTRVITNQHDLETALKERYGGRFEVFQGGTSIHRAISVFQNAAIVIGSHGEAMYNTLWASRNCRIVEILPVRKDGGYPDQGKPMEPPKFEHLSFYTMSMMNFQKFYRYYSPSRTINYEVNVPKFMRWVGKLFPLPAG